MTTALEFLQRFDQWVCWKYVIKPGATKPSKPPFDPHTGRYAAVNKPTTWGSHDDAVTAAKRRAMSGIGIVITDDMQVTGIDLDNVINEATGEMAPWVRDIVDLGETYAEISPSGTGIRMWALGSSDTIKCDPAGVEVYSYARFLTWTGRRVPGTPDEIRPAPETLRLLRARVDEVRRSEPEPEHAPAAAPARREPARVERTNGKDFFRSVNDAALQHRDAWVRKLLPAARHNPNGSWRVSSRALGRNLQEDLSIAANGIWDYGTEEARTAIDLVMEYSAKSAPIDAAMWLCDAMGIDPAQLGYTDRIDTSLIDGAITAFLRDGASGEPEIVDSETGDVIEIEREPVGLGAYDLPDTLTHVPGVIGEIMSFVLRRGSVKSRPIALVTALAVMSGVTGRIWMGPTQSATNLYILLLAPTGSGKDTVFSLGPEILTSHADLSRVNGASRFMSESAVYQRVKTTPCSVAFVDEFGGVMKKISNKRAGAHEAAITTALRLMWSANFKVVTTPDYAQKVGDSFHAPHLAMACGAPHEDLFAAMSGDDVMNGFLNRFLLVSIHTRQEDNRSKSDEPVPESITEYLRKLYGHGIRDEMLMIENPNAKPPTQMVPWSSEAVHDIWEGARNTYRDMAARQPSTEPFIARTAEMAVRLATLWALSVDPVNPAIDEDAIRWGLSFAQYSAFAMQRLAEDHMAETPFQDSVNRVRRIVRDSKNGASYRDIMRRTGCRMNSRDLKMAIEALCDSGAIVGVEIVQCPRAKDHPIFCDEGKMTTRLHKC